MFRLILFFGLISFNGCINRQREILPVQNILLQDYSFLIIDNEIRTLHQSHDTLYELHCYLDRPCSPKPEKHYKILSASAASGNVILKLEKLDTVRMSSNPYPAKRYILLALHNITNEELGYLPLKLNLTKAAIDTIQTDVDSLQDKFFFTYFSNISLKKFSTLKPIVNKSDAKSIIDFIKGEKYKSLIEKYKRTRPADMYAAGISAELLNKACLDLGYNLVGAGLKINALMK